MPPRRALARGLLLSCAAVLLLAAPVLVTLPPAAEAVQYRDPTPSATGTPDNPVPAKLARPPASLPRQAATTVVISEFRTRGPSSNGYASDEFIELFNPTGAAIDISGWSLWRSADCALADAPIHTFADPDPTTLQSGQHLLVAGLNYSGSVAPDVSGINIGVDDQGGIALKDAAAIPQVVDMVGMCDETSYFETDPLDALSGNLNQSYDRETELGGACTDSGNNLADFFLRSPSDPQNSSSLVSICGNPTPEPPPTATRTATAPPPPRVVINEIGWGGTGASSADQWIELFNAGGSPADLNGWFLEAPNTAFEVVLQGTIPANEYFLLVWGTSAQATATPAASVCVGFNNRTYNQIFSRNFSDTGEVIYLKEGNVIRDTAGQTLTNWWAGQAGPPPRSMERTGPPALSSIPTNSQTAWFTYGTSAGTARDCDNNPVFGTPKESNWAVTVTRTPGPTKAPPRTPTPRPPTPFAHMVINEFLPRAGSDWNGDGAVNVYDEFIEIKNNGPIDGNLEGWKLDDAADLGSPAFTLPNLVLKPGERAVFYGLTTRILLEDSGDTVRLINAQGAVIDGRNYGVVETLDISHCRIPDGYYWRTACFSTPGNENALTGVAPLPAPILLGKPAPCLLPDTAPEPFIQAECQAYGEDMWDRAFWDAPKPALFIVEGAHTKWKTSIE